jgi:hypothetical protein
MGTHSFIPGLWIRIDLIQIRIQQFFSIRIQAKTELKLISAFFPLKFLSFLAPGSGSGFPIRIQIHKVSESGSSPDLDPQPWFIRYIVTVTSLVTTVTN